MKHRQTSVHHTTRGLLAIACSTTFAAALTVALAQSAHAAPIIVPDVPDGLKVDAPNHPFRLGKAKGTQNYVCLPAGVDAAGNPAFAWKLFTPEATLFNDDPSDPKQLITHFFSPNPDETNANPFTDFHPVRAAWQDSKDTSTVWARTFKASDSAVVTKGAIPWLKLTVVGFRHGPTGGDALTGTTFIQRVNITGGVAPPDDTCDSPEEVGSQAFSDYTADYIFYTDQ
jgi:hypothetical protein